MKRIFACVLAGILLLLSASGCGILDQLGEVIKDEPVTVTAYDETFSVEMPASWQKKDRELNPVSQLTVSDLTENVFMIFVTEAKMDFAEGVTKRDVVEAMSGNVAKAGTDTTTGTPIEEVICGRNGIKLRVETTIGQTRLVYHLFVIEFEDYYLEVTGWSIPSKENSALASFAAIMDTYQEL